MTNVERIPLESSIEYLGNDVRRVEQSVNFEIGANRARDKHLHDRLTVIERRLGEMAVMLERVERLLVDREVTA